MDELLADLEQEPAAFRRLCVETPLNVCQYIAISPAAFRRLCVETNLGLKPCGRLRQPPLGGCVLKLLGMVRGSNGSGQQPSGGCMLKYCPSRLLFF